MTETNDLPRRMFAVGHEPVGLRVSPYHKPGALSHILESLQESEIEVLKKSPFGKFLKLADKTPYSGRLGRYMLSRQLKVRKKHEAWFLFAENPIRFSPREFAIVTGLPCGKYPEPPQQEASRMISEHPYYTTLFGMLKEVTATSVIRMLKRKTITDPDARIKYACLAILSYVLLPTTHVPKILVEHAEKIRDLDEFFAYLWGRVSFEMVMNSIKERDEVALTQSTIALQGYVQSLQMVLTKAVPALTEVVSEDSSTDAAGADDGDFAFPPSKNGIKPAHAMTLDTADNVRVTSIIHADNDSEFDEECLCYSDEEDDASVDKLVTLIRDGARFTKDMFIGGATTADVERMRMEAEAEAHAKKRKKRKAPSQTTPSPTQVHGDAENVVSLVHAKIKGDIDRIEGKVDKLRGSFDLLKGAVEKHLSEESALRRDLQHIYKTILESIASLSSQNHARSAEDITVPVSQADNVQPQTTNPPTGQTDPKGPGEVSEYINSVLDSVQTAYGDTTTETDIPEPQRATGSRDADIVDEDTNTNQKSMGEDDNVQSHLDVQSTDDVQSSELQLPEADPVDERMSVEDDQPIVDKEARPEDQETEADIPLRKSSRIKAVTKSLVGDYHCDKLILNRFRETQLGAINKDAAADYPAKFTKLLSILKTTKSITIGSISVSNKDIIDIVERSRALSLKMMDVLMHHSQLVTLHRTNPRVNCCFLDSKFVSILSKNYSRFAKCPRKEEFAFTPNVLEIIGDPKTQSVDSVRFYLPFNLDKNYWVGICVDSTSWTLIVLDCHTSLRSDAVMAKEMAPICHMFPYLLKQAGRNISGKELKALSLERPRNIIQNLKTTDSGVTTALLMQAHAVAGIEVCKTLTSDVLDQESKRLAVMLYEENAEPI